MNVICFFRQLYGDAVHSRRWVCLGLRQIGLFPPPVPSFPSPSPLSPRLGDHILPDLNQVDAECIPLPASVSLLSRDLLLPATAPHPIAILYAATPPAALPPFFVLDPDFPATEPFPFFNHLSTQFSTTFGLPFTSSLDSKYIRTFSTSEIFSCYSVPPSAIAAIPLAANPFDYALSLSTCCPIQLGSGIGDHLIDIHLFASIDATNSPVEFVTRSLVSTVSASTRPIPSPLD
jgi:hypothetical protein